MAWTRTLYWLLARRIRSSWPLLAVTSFGILAAVTLMAVGAIYSRGIAEAGLRHTLGIAKPSALDAQVIVQNRPLGPEDYHKLRGEVEQIAEARVGNMTRAIHRFGRTLPDWPLVFSADGTQTIQGNIVGRPFFLTGFKEHSRLADGSWPKADVSRDDGILRLEVLLGVRAANNFHLTTGSQVSVYPFRSDPSQRVVLTVAGLVEPIDPREEYWLDIQSYFNVERRGPRGDIVLVPFYVPEEAFFDGLGAAYPAAAGDFGWFLYFDTRTVTAGNTGPTRDSIIGLETDINKRFPRTFVFAGLKNRLSDYQKELTFARVPVYLFIGLVVLVVLYFLALVMGLLTRYRAEEASLLRSRGGSVLQVSTLLIAAEGVIALAAIAVGPFVALAIVKYLLLGAMNPVGVDEGGLSVGLSADMFVMGAIGGGLSLAVLAAHSVSLARQGVADSLVQRTRPPSVSFLHRYYIDLLVLAVLGVLWWQISGRGGFVSRDTASRALEVDPSLLFGPVMVLLAAAVIALRILPWLVRLLAWGVSRSSPAWAALSLARLSRDSLPHGSLLIILMLAAAVGVFGASFQSTLARSQKEQALFRQGGDIVLRGSGFEESVQAAMSNTPGVEAVTPWTRESVVLVDGFPGAFSSLIRLDPETFPRTSWFRKDFADESLDDLLTPLRPNQPRALFPALDSATGIVIPVGAERMGLWVNAADLQRDTGQRNLNVWARVLDTKERLHNILLGNLLEAGSEDGWSYLEAALPVRDRQPEVQFALVSLFITKQIASAVQPGSLSLDDVTVKGPGFPEMGSVIEDFEQPGAWRALTGQAVEPDVIEYLPEAARNGNGGLRYSWRTPISGTLRGIFLPSGAYPLPAVGSDGFQVGQVVRFQAGDQVIAVSITGVTDYFPTLTSSSRLFLLVADEDYRRHVERIFELRLDPPPQVWVSPQPGVDRRQVISALVEHVPGHVSVGDRKAMVSLVERDPLAGGGWNGLTILAMAAITIAVTLTLAIHGLVAVRSGRVDLTVARALGFSNFQVFGALALERLLIAALGIGVGSGLGVWLGRWVLGFLDVTIAGRGVIPPMIIGLEGWLVGLVLACLGAAAVLSLVLAALWARGLKAADVLRGAQ